jgi:hypothetical protein
VGFGFGGFFKDALKESEDDDGKENEGDSVGGFLDFKAGGADELEELFKAVAAVMAQGFIVFTPKELVSGNGNKEVSAGFNNAREVAQEFLVVGDMFEQVECEQDIA